MVVASVLDTCVIIGVVAEVDQHHTNCVEYIRDRDYDFWITPCVKDEFDDLIEHIRTTLEDEISAHRHKVISEVDDDTLGRSGLNYIQNTILPDDPTELRSYTFLYEYYEHLKANRVEVDKLEIEMFLEDLQLEVYEDASNEELGGWDSHVDIWNRGCDSYPDVERDLLVREGDDPDVCLEAHHVAIECDSDTTVIATTNTNHFLDKHETEPESREDNITRITNLDRVDDLSYPLIPSGAGNSRSFS